MMKIIKLTVNSIGIAVVSGSEILIPQIKN